MAPAPIRYVYGWDDYVVLSRTMRRENVWKRYQLLIVPAFLSICFVAGVAGIAGLRDKDVGLTLRFVFSSWWSWLVPFAAAIFVMIMNRIEMGLWYRRQRIDGVEVAIAFDDPDGLATSSKDGRGTIGWGAIRKVATGDGAHVVLQNNTIFGVLLPRRAFGSDAEFDAAKAFIERKIEMNRGSVT